MSKKLVSVIVPAYKKAATIAKDLRRINSAMSKLGCPYEIICVVDGFVDKTYENALPLAKQLSKIKVVGYPTNKGKGHAVRYGMAKSRGHIIGFIDSGMDINPSGISMILEHFEWYHADIIVASKRHLASKVNWTLKRRILSLGYQFVNRLLFGLKIRDTQVGLKFYRREVLEKVLPRLIVKKYAFDVELLAVAYFLGFRRMYEGPVEIDFTADNSTSASAFNHIFRMLVDTLAIFYRLRILNYYSDSNSRAWIFDPELNFRVNTI